MMDQGIVVAIEAANHLGFRSMPPQYCSSKWMDWKPASTGSATRSPRSVSNPALVKCGWPATPKSV